MIVLLITLHILSAVFWVGGMLFAHQILRPAAGPLEPSVRLPLWRRVFARFLPAVGAAVVLLLVSGYGMIFLEFGGFAHLPLYVNVMQTLGIIMMLMYLHLMFAPWKRLRAALDRGGLADAARNLDQIRLIVTINMLLGVITIVVGATGRYW